jgi:REP element-mobilizing transposase RayT
MARQEHRDTAATAYPQPDPAQHGQATLRIRQGARLPHWTKQGSTYSVTFRLYDSLPQKILAAWRFEREDVIKIAQKMKRPLSMHEERRLHELHSERVEKYLDAGHGACWMKKDRVAQIVAQTLLHFDSQRYDLSAWCVMPNHVHVVVRPHAGQELPGIVHSWKSFSAKAANKVLKRKGRFWQVEYYDHLIRDEADFQHCVDYVLRNPQQAGLTGWRWVSSTGVPPVRDRVARASRP